MTDAFLDYMKPILSKEGGDTVTNDPADRGGLTKYGITQATATAAGYKGSVANMTLDEALAIYRANFWTRPNFDKVDAISSTLSTFLLDTGINCGVGVPSKHLQRCLNVLNQGGAAWADIAADGAVGPGTIAALSAFKAARGAEGMKVLMGMMRALASVRYIELAEANPSQERFEYGWQRTRAFDLAA